ncbi:MAG: hypothetical protein WC126_04875 [Proteiniphilum sp.]|nr:hypothetical protein [Proteiniphilum sp.]
MSNAPTQGNPMRRLYRHYYCSISILALLFLLILFHLLPLYRGCQSVGVTCERYAIMITLITIPAILKWFAHQLKKSPRPMVRRDAITRYSRAYYLRHYTISAGTLFHIVLFGLSRNLNFFWCSVLLFMIFFFCRPSLPELENLLEKPEATEEGERELQDTDSDETLIGK